jgi:hypothetical protein
MSNGSSSPRRHPSSSYYSNSPLASPLTRQPPLFPNSANARRVTEDELEDLNERVTRPTVASRGGVDLQDKDFTYIQPRRLKTLPCLPGLERRYLGLQPVDAGKMDEIVGRLTRLTSAYQAKFAPNRNVWIDMEPGAHIVMQRRGAQSAR